MISRFGPVVIGLCLLLAATPVEAQSPIQSKQVPAARSPLQAVAALSLQVVRQGRQEQLNVTADALARTGEIVVDGYVNGLVVLSRSPLIIHVDQQPLNAIPTTADGQYRISHFGKMAPSRFWSTYLADAARHIAPAQIQGRYALFAPVPWDALVKRREFRIVFNGYGAPYACTVRHDTPVRLRAKAGPSEIDYLGDDPTRFRQATADFDQRLAAIQEGIRRVETAAALKVVEKVHLIDRVDGDGPRNAYTRKDLAEIWIYSGLFRHESLPELRSVVEHEAMHLLADRLGLPANPRVRGLFAALKAFAPQSREYFRVLATGHPPQGPADAAPPAGAGLLFDFINESNFIRGMSGGHAQDSVDEFCASFLHTLLYSDRLGPLLGQPVITHRGALLSLSPADQGRLLAAYHSVLETMGSEIEGMDPPPPLRAIFRAGLAATHGLGVPFNVRCAEVPDTPARQPS